MATVERIVLECDTCKAKGDGVLTHTIALDGKTVEVEACGKCWTKAEKTLVPLMTAGRKIRRPRRAA